MDSKEQYLNNLQLALDIVGIEPTIGTVADASNVVISLLRAASDKESDERRKHLIDAGISAISMVPFADVVKLLKLRKLRKPAINLARTIKTGAESTPKSYTAEHMKIKKSQLKEEIKQIVRESLEERCGGKGHLAGGKKGERMFKHIKAGYKGEKSQEDAERIAAATVNKQLGKEQVGADVVANEAGLTSEEGHEHEYKESSELKVVKVIKSAAERIIALHSNANYDEQKEKDLIRTIETAVALLSNMHEKGSVKDNEKKEEVDEASYKIASPAQYRTSKCDHARRIQTEPEVTENHKVQARSAKTVKDLDNDPKNVRDPKVPQA